MTPAKPISRAYPWIREKIWGRNAATASPFIGAGREWATTNPSSNATTAPATSGSRAKCSTISAGDQSVWSGLPKSAPTVRGSSGTRFGLAPGAGPAPAAGWVPAAAGALSSARNASGIRSFSSGSAAAASGGGAGSRDNGVLENKEGISGSGTAFLRGAPFRNAGATT